MTRLHRALLAIAGLVAVVIGAVVLVAPQLIHDSNGVDFESDPNLLSEIRSPGGALLAVGALLLAALFVQRLVFAATLAGAAVYLGYGFARLVAMAIDGPPSSSTVAATLVELAIGLALAWLLWTSRARVPQQ